MARISLVRACARSRCAWNTKKLIWMPAANFFSSASRRRSVDSLLVGLHLSPGVSHLRRDLEFQVLELRLLLGVLQFRLGEVGLLEARAERIRNRDTESP